LILADFSLVTRLQLKTYPEEGASERPSSVKNMVTPSDAATDAANPGDTAQERPPI